MVTIICIFPAPTVYPTPIKLPVPIPFAPALPVAVDVPIPRQGYVDSYIDNIL